MADVLRGLQFGGSQLVREFAWNPFLVVFRRDTGAPLGDRKIPPVHPEHALKQVSPGQ